MSKWLHNFWWPFVKKGKVIEDPDFNRMASRVKDMFHGYPFVLQCTSSSFYQITADYGPGGMICTYDEAFDWAHKNLSDKFKPAFLRVLQDWNGDWTVNEIGGADYIFIGFKNEQDYLWFKLKWD